MVGYFTNTLYMVYRFYKEEPGFSLGYYTEILDCLHFEEYFWAKRLGIGFCIWEGVMLFKDVNPWRIWKKLKEETKKEEEKGEADE